MTRVAFAVCLTLAIWVAIQYADGGYSLRLWWSHNPLLRRGLQRIRKIVRRGA